MSDLSVHLRPRNQARLYLSVSAMVMLAPAIWLGIASYETHQGIERQQARNDRMSQRLASAARPTAKPVRSEQILSQQWADLKGERDFPWQKVFQTVERAASADIELLGFVPDKRNRRIVLRGQSRDNQALLAYLDRLEAQPAVRQVYLTHQQAVTQDRLNTISFEIKISIR